MKTTKKQKIVGTMTLVNSATGELIPTQLVEVEDRDYSFHKFWLKNFCLATDEIRNVKMDLVLWLIDNLNAENQIVMTQKVIAKRSGVSLATVQRTLRALMNSSPPFLVKINSGAYQINPDIIWKGSHSKRMAQMFQFSEEKTNNFL